MRKLPIPPLSTTAYTTKTSKQKKTDGEKQAKKKELDRATLQGGALETSWSAAERGWDLEVVLVQIFMLSPLSSQSYRILL